jgi:hypothetical protein
MVSSGAPPSKKRRPLSGASLLVEPRFGDGIGRGE